MCSRFDLEKLLLINFRSGHLAGLIEMLTCLSVQCLWSGVLQEAVGWVFASQEMLTKLTRSTRDHFCSCIRSAGQHTLRDLSEVLFINLALYS